VYCLSVITMRLLLKLLLAFTFAAPLTTNALDGCYRVASTCVDSGTKCITPVGGGSCHNVTRDCWEYEDQYECYTGEVTDSCADNNVDLSGCYLQDTVCHKERNGSCVEWTANYICDEKLVTTCEDTAVDTICHGDPNCDLSHFDCRITGQTCTEGPETRVIDGVSIYRDCWDTEVNWECYTGEQSKICSGNLSSCEVTGQTCMANDPVDGRCTEWVERLVCPDEADISCDTSGEVTGSCDAYNSECLEENEDGYCVKYKEDSACQSGPPEICETDPACELVGTECVSYTGDLCDAERQVYSCKKEKNEYIKTETTTTCAGGDIVHGLDSVTSPEASDRFGEAMTNMAILDAIQREMSPNSVSIFAGKKNMCEDPVLSSWLTNDCCRLDVRDEGDNLLALCTDYEIELAAARRADRTHYVGRWCSEELDLLVTEICLMKANGYCQFNSILGRIIQEQGRSQLAQLAATGYAGAQKQTVVFDLYADAGQWLPSVSVNGNQLTAWQWPAYCLSKEDELAALEANPSATLCPMVEETWFAACAEPNGCGALPVDPRISSSGWIVNKADPAENQTTTLSRYAVTTGSCVNNDCSYQFAAWPAGSGGAAQVGMDMSWSLYGLQPGFTGQIYQLSNFQFEPYAFAVGDEPAIIPLRVSTDKGDTWTTYHIPPNIVGTDYKLPSNPQITIFGNCDTTTLECNYRVIIPINVTAKPWGNPENPDCSGFTVEELSVLDFEKMNLDEWLASDEANLPNPEEMTANAAEDVETFYSTYSEGGQAVSHSPQSTKFFKVTPTEGVGPFTVQFEAPSTWPTANSNDDIDQLQIHWGDGTSSFATLTGGLYKSSHTYPVAPGADTQYTLGTKIHSSTGYHSASATIINYIDTPEPGQQDTGGGAGDDIYSYTPSRTANGVDGRNALPMDTYQEVNP